MNKIKITKEKWKLFEYYHSVYQKQVPNWRLGQAFTHFFSQDLEQAGIGRRELYIIDDDAEAQALIESYIEIID